MSLNPSSASDSSGFVSEPPCAKLTFNINAFNGNTTNFNLAPKKKAMPTTIPIQPQNADMPSFGRPTRSPGMIMPL